MIEKYYNVHDIVTFKVVDRRNVKFLGNIENAFKNFESKKVDDPDFTIYIGKFSPSNQDYYILDDLYYVKENCLYCKDSYKLTTWELEVSGIEENNTLIRVSTSLFGGAFIHDTIDFFIHFKMNEKGYSVIHGSAVSKDKKAFLFPAQSGAGKTMIALDLVEKGFDFLGDNFVILHEGNILSYLSPLGIFTYNLAPIIKRKLGIKNRSVLYLKHLLYHMSRGYIKIFTQVNVRDKFPNSIVDKSKLSSIFLKYLAD